MSLSINTQCRKRGGSITYLLGHIMTLINMAADLFKSQLGSQGSNLDTGNIIAALQDLLPTNGGDIDIANLIAQFTQGDLGSLVNSFLGDGANANMSVENILAILGQNKVENFASQLDIQPDTAANTLSDIIPQLIDKNSGGGDLMGMAGKMLGGFFK